MIKITTFPQRFWSWLSQKSREIKDVQKVSYTSKRTLVRGLTPPKIGSQVVAVVNFPPMRIVGFKSEVLVIGGVPEEGDVRAIKARWTY